MLIAVASDGLNVCTSQASLTGFMCYTVNRGVIVRSQYFSGPIAPGTSWLSALAMLEIDTLLVYALDPPTKDKLAELGIEVASGFHGTIEAAVKEYLSVLMSGCDDDYLERVAS